MKNRGFFFGGEFSPPADKKKKAGVSNKWIFEIKKKNSPYLEEKKKLEVARFRQCLPLGRQNYAGFQKKFTSPPGQSPLIAN